MPMPCTVGALINTARLQYPTLIHRHFHHHHPNVIFVILLTPAKFQADIKNSLILDFLTPKNTKFRILTPKHINSHLVYTRLTNIRYVIIVQILRRSLVLFHENVWSCSVNAIRPHASKIDENLQFSKVSIILIFITIEARMCLKKCGGLRFNQSVVDHFILSSNIINSSKSIQSW